VVASGRAQVIWHVSCPIFSVLFNAPDAKRRNLGEEEAAMEKTFTDVGQRVGTEWSQGDVVSPGRSASEGRAAIIGKDLAEGARALQCAVKQGAVMIGHEVKDRGDEVIAYTRREPVRALMAAAGIGLIAGLSMALGARAERRRSGWLAQLTQASGLAKPLAAGWRSFMRLR